MHSKAKRVLAIIGIIILAGLYLTTLFLALFGNENTKTWFMASICATVVVPILMWVYSWLYKMLKKDVADAASENRDSSETEE